MGYKRTLMDDATDELFAHMQRCKVPGATEEDVREWMNDTRQFLADRYPQLSEAQLAKLEMIGRRYAQPVIPHGKEATARNREEWEGDVAEAQAAHPEAPEATAEVTDITDEGESSEGEPNALQTA